MALPEHSVPVGLDTTYENKSSLGVLSFFRSAL